MQIVDTLIVCGGLIWLIYYSEKSKDSLWTALIALSLFQNAFFFTSPVFSNLVLAGQIIIPACIIFKQLQNCRLNIRLHNDVLMLVVFILVLYIMLPNGYRN